MSDQSVFRDSASRLLRASALAIALLPVAASAVIINSSFTGFTADQESIIRQAGQQWSLVVGGRDQININYTVDNSLSALAETGGWATAANGRPISADIAVRESGLNWTAGLPAAGQTDAMYAISHEIGHAAGFAAGALPNFQANVLTTGAQRYYDVDRSGTFSASVDFALGPVANGTHTPAGSGDLMQPTAVLSARPTPNLRHAAVLTDAFGYDVILNGFGGPAGYGSLAMSRNDDQSSSRLNLPFGLNFYGTNYNNFFINNNGNITFNGPVGTYTPSPFPISGQPMIAPFWADVDTRCGSCGSVYVASPDSNTVLVTWDQVGYYSNHSDKTNTFQLVLRNRPDSSAGNFDAEFRYGNLSWTTGDASGGSGGAGGTPAQAGLDAGDQTNFFTLPGSRTAGVVNLATTTNLASPIPGVWSFAVRNGTPPGGSADNPLLPVVTSNGWNFNFNIGPNTGRVFIDPLLAIGYDYIVNSGPNVQSVLLPTGIGDNIFELWLYNTVLGQFVNSGINILGGQIYDFGSGGVDRFSIRGIEIAAGLDPNDFTAFVTGLTFAGIGTVDLSMIAVTVNTGGGQVPLPSTLVLVGLGLLTLRSAQRQKHQHTG